MCFVIVNRLRLFAVIIMKYHWRFHQPIRLLYRLFEFKVNVPLPRSRPCHRYVIRARTCRHRRRPRSPDTSPATLRLLSDAPADDYVYKELKQHTASGWPADPNAVVPGELRQYHTFAEVLVICEDFYLSHCYSPVFDCV